VPRPSPPIYLLHCGITITTDPPPKAQVTHPLPPPTLFILAPSSRLISSRMYACSGQVILPAPLDIIPLHYRGGSIVPTQAPAVTTTASRTNPFGADIAFGESGAAEGWAYLDDGVSANAPYTMLHMTARSTSGCSGAVTISSTVSDYKPSVVFGKFRFMGIDPSCWAGSVPIVSANSRAVASVQWTGTLLTVDLGALAIDVERPLQVAFAPPSLQ
jgi:hypothetical protein